MTCGVCMCRIACKAAPSAKCPVIKLVGIMIDTDVELYKLNEKYGTPRIDT